MKFEQLADAPSSTNIGPSSVSRIFSGLLSRSLFQWNEAMGFRRQITNEIFDYVNFLLGERQQVAQTCEQRWVISIEEPKSEALEKRHINQRLALSVPL